MLATLVAAEVGREHRVVPVLNEVVVVRIVVAELGRVAVLVDAVAGNLRRPGVDRRVGVVAVIRRDGRVFAGVRAVQVRGHDGVAPVLDEVVVVGVVVADVAGDAVLIDAVGDHLDADRAADGGVVVVAVIDVGIGVVVVVQILGLVAATVVVEVGGGPADLALWARVGDVRERVVVVVEVLARVLATVLVVVRRRLVRGPAEVALRAVVVDVRDAVVVVVGIGAVGEGVAVVVGRLVDEVEVAVAVDRVAELRRAGVGVLDRVVAVAVRVRRRGGADAVLDRGAVAVAVAVEVDALFAEAVLVVVLVVRVAVVVLHAGRALVVAVVAAVPVRDRLAPVRDRVVVRRVLRDVGVEAHRRPVAGVEAPRGVVVDGVDLEVAAAGAGGHFADAGGDDVDLVLGVAQDVVHPGGGVAAGHSLEGGLVRVAAEHDVRAGADEDRVGDHEALAAVVLEPHALHLDRVGGGVLQLEPLSRLGADRVRVDLRDEQVADGDRFLVEHAVAIVVHRRRADFVLFAGVDRGVGVVAVLGVVARDGRGGGDERALDPLVLVRVAFEHALEGAVGGVVERLGGAAAAVGVEAVADLGQAGVDVRGHRQGHRVAGVPVVGHLVEAVAVAEAGGGEVALDAVALDVGVAVGVVLGQPVGDVAARAAVRVEAVADLQSTRVHERADRRGRHREGRVAGVGGVLVEAVLAREEAGVEEPRRGAGALDVAVVVVVVLVGRGGDVAAAAAVGVESVADVARAGVHVEPDGRGRHREGAEARVGGGLVEAILAREEAGVGEPRGGRDALEVAVAVGVVLDHVVTGVGAAAAVGVESVAHLGGPGVDVEPDVVGVHRGTRGRVGAVLIEAVLAGEEAGVGEPRCGAGALDVAVAVVVVLVGRGGDVAAAAAVGVESVAHVARAGVHVEPDGRGRHREGAEARVGGGLVEAVLAGEEAGVGEPRDGRGALDVAVAVGVVLVPVVAVVVAAAAVGVEPVADLGGAGVDVEPHRRGGHERAGLGVGGVLVEAVVAVDDRVAQGVHRAGAGVEPAALDVAVEVVVPLIRLGADERRVDARAGVVPAVALAGGVGREDVRERTRAVAAGLGGGVRAVVAARQVQVREVDGIDPDIESAVGALDVGVAVVVDLVGVGGSDGEERPAEAVVLPTVAELLGVGVDVEGRHVGVAARVGVADLGQELGLELGAAVDAVAVAADRVAVAVGVELVVLGRVRALAAEVAVAVVVDAVAQLGGRRVDGRVAVVAVAVVLGLAVAVVVHIERIDGRAVAVVPRPGGPGVDAAVSGGAVAADHVRDRRAGPALHIAVAVAVDFGGRGHAVAVVVDAVADLEEDRGAVLVVVVAVAEGLAEAVVVQIQLAGDAGVAGVPRDADAAEHLFEAVLVVAAGIEARHAVGVVAGVARALVVDEDEVARGRVVVRVRDLRGPGVDVAGVGVGEGVVFAVATADVADDAGVPDGPRQLLDRAGDVAIAVAVDLVERDEAVAVVVEAVAQLVRAGVDRGRGVVAVAGDLVLAVDVAVGLAQVEEAVAVVVGVVAGHLDRRRVHARDRVVAVARADREAVRVGVRLVGGDDAVAVVVDGVAVLGVAEVDIRVAVVAVEGNTLGGGRAERSAVGVGVHVVGVHAPVAVAVAAVADLVGGGEHGREGVVAVPQERSEAGRGGPAAELRRSRLRRGDAPAVAVAVPVVRREDTRIVRGVAVVVDLIRGDPVLAELGGGRVGAGVVVLAVVGGGGLVERGLGVLVQEAGRCDLGVAAARDGQVAPSVAVGVDDQVGRAIAVVVDLDVRLADLGSVGVLVEAVVLGDVVAVLLVATDADAEAVAVEVSDVDPREAGQ